MQHWGCTEGRFTKKIQDGAKAECLKRVGTISDAAVGCTAEQYDSRGPMTDQIGIRWCFIYFQCTTPLIITCLVYSVEKPFGSYRLTRVISLAFGCANVKDVRGWSFTARIQIKKDGF